MIVHVDVDVDVDVDDHPTLSLTLSLTLFLTACSSTPGAPDAIDAPSDALQPHCRLPAPPAAPDPAAPVALFALDGAEPSAPYPFDIFTRAKAGSPTGLLLDIADSNTVTIDSAVAFISPMIDLKSYMNVTDGFSVFGPIVFSFTAPLEKTMAASHPLTFVDPASPVFLLEIDKVKGACGGRVPVFVRIEDVEAESGPRAILAIEPYTPLKPATAYAAVITRELKGAGGRPVTQHPHFRSAAGLSGDGPPGARAEKAAALMGSLGACLGTLDMCMDDLAAATVFTTRDAPANLRAMRDVMHRKDAPPIELALDKDEKGAVILYEPAELPGMPAGQDLTTSSVAVRGAFDSPDFRAGDRDVHVTPGDVPAIGKTLRIPFVLLLPADSKKPPFKVVVMEHGHSGQKERVGHLARRFGEQGLALAGIDLLGHGELKDEGGYMPTDVHQARGSFIQSDVNLLRFFQALSELKTLDIFPPGAPDGVPDLDLAGGFGMVGESLGMLTGAAACSLEEQCRAAVLNVGGGGMTNFAPDTVGPLLSGANRFAYWGLRAGLQGVVDDFDPMAYARLLAQGAGKRSLLMQAVIGDTAFEGPPTNDLARALGLTHVCPCPKPVPYLDTVPAPAAINGLSYYAGVAHGFLLANASNPAGSDAVRYQAAWFLRTGLDKGQGEVVDGWLHTSDLPDR